jgi:hypothetical protein
MKIASKILLIVLLLLNFSYPLADRAYAMAQITMVNRSQLTLYLYIDGNFGCGPVGGLGRFTNSPGLFCTSSVTPGPHRLEARDGEKVVAHEDNVNIGDGTSPTWTVTIEDPDQALIKKLDGARYSVQDNTARMVNVTCTLDIKGTTLIERCCVTWARPDIAQSMAMGTNGFPRRPVGTWYDIGQGQIIGRVAHIYADRGLGNEDRVCTISEDGNSITEEIKGNISIYHRQ